jgi:hypothetical protein
MPFGIQISSTIKKLLQENIYVLVKEGRKKKKTEDRGSSGKWTTK